MKRNLELIRKMVLAVEDGPDGYAPDDLRIDGYTDEQLAYHAHLLVEAGLATWAITTHMGSSGPTAQITTLTWEGYDFAATARDETQWRKVVGIVQEKGGALTLDIVKDLLLRVARASVGL